MSIFKKSRINTSSFSLGRPEAEAELKETTDYPSIKDLFVDSIGVINAISNGRFIITGRKGSGKSAIVGYITLNSYPYDNTSYCKVVKPYHCMSIISQMIENKSERFRILYDWTIISKLVEMILSTKQGEYTSEIQTLKKFHNKYPELFSLDIILKTKRRMDLKRNGGCVKRNGS